MRCTGARQRNNRELPRRIAVAAFVCLALVAASGCAAWALYVQNSPATWENASAGQSVLNGAAFADGDQEKVGSTFTVDGDTYSVIEVADADGASNKVTLTNVDSAKQGGFSIPASVTSPATGTSYAVTRFTFNAFTSCKSITEVTIPASVTDFEFANNVFSDNQNACFIRCSSLASVKVSDDSPCFAAIDGALYAKGASGLPVALLCVPAASGITELEVPSTVRTVAAFAANGASSLVNVHFSGDLTGDAVANATAGALAPAYAGGIGASAFADCTSLSSVTFDDGLKIGVATGGISAAIGTNAFSGCVSLASITIPDLESATRKADAYHTFDQYNPGSNQTSGTDSEFKSGFSPYWHEVSGPCARVGIGTGAFSGCSSLKTVTFATGNSNGAFAYFAGSNTYFSGCDSLEALVFEGQQSYFGDPSRSMMNGAVTDIWYDSSADEYVLANVPTRYYAVDYYATSDQAEAADVNGSTRLARVEYAAGTSVADIQSGADSLSEATVDRETYALAEADGVIPSASEAAAAAGLGEGDWAWKLTGTQSRREGLTESCKAYLVNRNDISAGRLDSEVQTALYLACDRNLSQSQQADCAFDPARYASGASYYIQALSGETDPWYNYDMTTGGLLNPFAVRAADGTLLSSGDYAVSYKTYDVQTGQLVDAELSQGTGAYLACITPTAESGYTGELQEWIVVKSHVGTVVSGLSDTVSGTANAARHAYSQVTQLDFSDRRYSVTVGANDAAGALVASGFAGLVGGAVNVDDSDSASYGFMINPVTDKNGIPTDTSSSYTFSRTSSDGEIDAAAYAVKAFTQFEKNRTSLGASEDDYPWGDTAVLMPRWYEQYYAAAANWAYLMHAPVFFTSDDGSVSSDTAACLGKFKQVVVMGSESALSAETYDALASMLPAGVGLSRIAAESDSVASFSLAVSADLIERGKASTLRVAVVDPLTPADAVAAVTFTGHEGGILLTTLSTADSVVIAKYLHANSGAVVTVLLAGREGCAAVLESSEWPDASAFGSIWEIDSIFDKVMEAVTSNVDEYPSVHIGPVEVDPQPSDDPAAGDGGEGDASGDGDGDASDNGNSGGGTYVRETYGGSVTYLTGTQGAASTSAKAVAKAAANASNNDSSSNATARKAAADGASEQEESSGSNALVDTLSRAPLTTTVPFLASLSALCAVAAPVLRRCK